MAHKKPPQHYVKEIDRLHNIMVKMPHGLERTTIENELHKKVQKWETKLNKVIYVASNEQTPWALYETVGLPVRPMKTKKESGHKQVGDYVCCVFIEDGRDRKLERYHKYLPLVVERKSLPDLHSSLVPSDTWARFKREIQRFHEDDRFNQMVIIAETSLQEFLKYKPELIRNKNGKMKYNKSHPVPPNVKRAKIAKCCVLGAPIVFAGTIHQAMNIYNDLIRQTIIEKYDVLLGLS